MNGRRLRRRFRPESPRHAWRFSGRLGVAEVLDAVQAAIASGRGFSLIRLGDGEGPLLAWPDLRRDRSAMKARIRFWFGDQSLDDSELLRLATELRAAVSGADVVGLPTRAHCDKLAEQERVLEAIEHYRLLQPHQRTCDSNMHWYLQFSGALAAILTNHDFVGIVGCRALGPAIETALGVRSTTTYLVRGESASAGAIAEPHWPTGFADICRRLTVPHPGALFLIGAGALGKIYCNLVKERGGVAIDVGSLFDSWAAIPTRGRYAQDPHTYSLDYLRMPPPSAAEMRQRLDRCVSALGIEEATY